MVLEGIYNLLIADANLCHADIKKLHDIRASGKMYHKRSEIMRILKNAESAEEHLKLLKKLGEYIYHA